MTKIKKQRQAGENLSMQFCPPPPSREAGLTEPLPLYLVRPEGFRPVLARLILFMVNQCVPAGTVHVGSLPDAEVTGTEAADGRPWNRNTALRQP